MPFGFDLDTTILPMNKTFDLQHSSTWGKQEVIRYHALAIATLGIA